MNDFTIINIREFLLDTGDIGEADLQHLISDFSCPQNLDVQSFLTNNAVEFTKKNQSVTYLVFTTIDAMLVGYFTIAIKPLTINGDKFSKTVLKKISRVSKLDEENNTFALSAYLIAQLGKNYTKECNLKISGKQLLEIALKTVYRLQYMTGGMVVFLETENHPKLLEFYGDKNDFKMFEIREVIHDKREKYALVQMLKIL
jgi:hypothetical protein